MQRKDVERLARLLDALSGDCAHTDGWEDGGATCTVAATALRALMAERDALQGQLNDLRNGWAKSVKAHAALLAERDAAFAAGLEAAAEAVLYLCRMKGMGNRTIDGPEAAHLIRALPIKDSPDGR